VIAEALAVLATAPTVVGVGAREWRLTPYRETVRRGAVTFVVHNFGEDPHDLRVLGPRGYRSAATPEIRSGETYRHTVRLRRSGRYRLVCTLPGHERRGMRSSLRVR
jgi:plastocyanin